MLRVEGISFVGGDGPVPGGFLRLSDATVLTGRNDSGKTKLLALIERALNSLRECEYVDVFGIVSDEELVECVDEMGRSSDRPGCAP